MSIKRLGVGKRMSEAVIHGGKVYLSGFVADKTVGKSVKEQTADILSQIDATLAPGGHRQEQAAQGQYLAHRHWQVRADECGLGRLGLARQYAGAGHG